MPVSANYLSTLSIPIFPINVQGIYDQRLYILSSGTTAVPFPGFLKSYTKASATKWLGSAQNAIHQSLKWELTNCF